MHSFYIEAPQDGAAYLLPEEAKHARKVLRLQVGETVCALDGAGQRFNARIEAMGEDGVRVRLLEVLPSNEPPVRVTLYQGIPKAEKLDFIAQKVTELGATALVPVKMERCVVKLDERDGQKRRERLERIACEAAKQCQRANAPEVAEPMTWAQAMQRMRTHDLLIVPWEEAEAKGRRMKQVYKEHSDAMDIGIVIGPEGGMSAQEVSALEQVDGRIITFGPRILRTETAGAVSVALAMQLWGDI